MKKLAILIFIILTFNIQTRGFRGNDTIPGYSGGDTTSFRTIEFTPADASGYLQQLIDDEQLWKESGDTLRHSIIQLIQQYKLPFDSTRNLLSDFDFNRLTYDTTLITKRDTLPLRWLNDTLFFVDTVPLKQSPVLTQKTIIMKTVVPDSATMQLIDSIPNLSVWIDSVIRIRDTITETRIDYQFLQSRNIRLHRLANEQISPPFIPPATSQIARFSADSSAAIISDYAMALIGSPQSPFNILPGGHVQDSLARAVTTLLEHTWVRDSVEIQLKNNGGPGTPFWLTAGESDDVRYWVKNRKNDSITVWLGNPSKYEISMLLEEKVNVERMGIIPADDVYFTTIRPDKTPAPVRPLTEIPVFWDYDFSGSFSLNQNYITYWAQGGESSFAGLLDLSGNAKYTNKQKETEWENSGRLRFGSVTTKEKGIRINTDILELNSQYNKVIIEKLDFSSVFYFKTQLAKGYNYPNDSVPISKFLNPGTFTIGVGAEYKPFSNMLINLSPLSYKNTFVLDTNDIDQTIHGVDENRKAKQEVGGQLVIKNKLTVLEGVKIGNTLRLFSNYADNPQNVDVDWEMSVERQIAWIFSVKLNIHLIYDDDVRFPVETPEGGEKKVPRTQFNQFLGLSVSLNL